MPSMDSWVSASDGLAAEFIRRRDAKKVTGLLPDVATPVIEAARAEATRIRAWVSQLDAEIERKRGELRTARAAVREKYLIVPGQSRMRGDPLTTGYRTEQGPSIGKQKPPEALALEKAKVRPIADRIAFLEKERAVRQQELGQLKRICAQASNGNPGVLNLLSDEWRSRLMVGAAVFGKLPPALRSLTEKATTPTDLSGEPLPEEALDADGKPDLTSIMRGGSRSSAGHLDTLPATPGPTANSRGEARRRRAAAGGG